MHRITRGLDLPIAGRPLQTVETCPPVRRVALLADDYWGIDARARVQEGDAVRVGDTLMSDHNAPGVSYVSPGSGRVAAVVRGECRALKAVVVELDREGGESKVFDPPAVEDPEGLRRLLVASGLWTGLRTRPFSRVPTPGETPHSLFVTAMDTAPLAADPAVVLSGRHDDFRRGLSALSKLTAGTTYVCKAPSTHLDLSGLNVRVEQFEGVHPAGTVGLHIHTLDPVHRGKTVWHIGYQDVLAVGRLLSTGALDPYRVVSLAGPGVVRPRLIRTRLGAAVDDLVEGQLAAGEQRVISGSVLCGRVATGPDEGFLGRYHQQICALPEGRERRLLSWLRPGSERFSVLRLFASSLRRGANARGLRWTTSTHGSRRSLVPMGTYERVMPLDLMPTHLLRALAAHDSEWAEELGALELSEEDLALCSVVCPGKADHGAHLRKVLCELARGEAG